jgi:16S rRNA (guanine527-N7)-methyltransferase
MTDLIKYAIAQGAADLRCGLPENGAARLADYVALLDKWNARINLTAIRDPAQMVTHHILDCLAIVPEVAQLTQGQPLRVADVGSGAGLPGLVLALAQPQLQITCIDTVEKKGAFVQQAIGLLGLKNAHAMAARVETVQERFDVVTCRAFAALAEIVQLSGHLLPPDGLLLAMKGPKVQEEAQALPTGWLFLGAIPLQVPGLKEERNLAVVRKV